MKKPTVKKLTLRRGHVLSALEGYLKAMSMMDDDYTVTDILGTGSEFTVIVEKE